MTLENAGFGGPKKQTFRDENPCLGDIYIYITLCFLPKNILLGDKTFGKNTGFGVKTKFFGDKTSNGFGALGGRFAAIIELGSPTNRLATPLPASLQAKVTVGR